MHHRPLDIIAPANIRPPFRVGGPRSRHREGTLGHGKPGYLSVHWLGLADPLLDDALGLQAGCGWVRHGGQDIRTRREHVGAADSTRTGRKLVCFALQHISGAKHGQRAQVRRSMQMLL